MCIRDRVKIARGRSDLEVCQPFLAACGAAGVPVVDDLNVCLLYTSDAADERSSVDLGGRRIIKKKKQAE